MLQSLMVSQYLHFKNHHTPTQNHIIIPRSWLVTSWLTQSTAAAYQNQWCQKSYTGFHHLLRFTVPSKQKPNTLKVMISSTSTDQRVARYCHFPDIRKLFVITSCSVFIPQFLFTFHYNLHNQHDTYCQSLNTKNRCWVFSVAGIVKQWGSFEVLLNRAFWNFTGRYCSLHYIRKCLQYISFQLHH
jgi:hypothetical protein